MRNPRTAFTAPGLLAATPNSPLTSRLDEGTLCTYPTLPMTAPCKHPQVRIVAREEDTEFVECQLCGEVFDAVEFDDMLLEEDATPDELRAEDEA